MRTGSAKVAGVASTQREQARLLEDAFLRGAARGEHDGNARTLAREILRLRKQVEIARQEGRREAMDALVAVLQNVLSPESIKILIDTVQARRG